MVAHLPFRRPLAGVLLLLVMMLLLLGLVVRSRVVVLYPRPCPHLPRLQRTVQARYSVFVASVAVELGLAYPHPLRLRLLLQQVLLPHQREPSPSSSVGSVSCPILFALRCGGLTLPL